MRNQEWCLTREQAFDLGTVDLTGDLPMLKRVPRSPETKPRRTLDSCDREIVMPSRRAISSANRAKVQLVRYATDAARLRPVQADAWSLAHPLRRGPEASPASFPAERPRAILTKPRETLRSKSLPST